MATPEYAHPICLQDLNLWGATSGTPTFSSSTLRSGGGTHKMVCASAGAVCRVDYQHAAGKRTVVETFYYRPTTTPSATCGIYAAINASGNATVSHLTGNTLRAGSGATNGSVTPSVTANTWYRIDVSVVVSGGVQTVRWWLDGVFQEQVTNSQADADLTASRLGNNAAVTHTSEYMDHVGSYTAADAPLGGYAAKLYDLAAAVGANHTLGSGAFQKTGAVAITSGDTNSQAELTEKPFSMTQYVAQTVLDATARLEYPLADSAESTAPALVLIGSLYNGAGSGAYTGELRVFDGTSEGTDLWAAGTKTGTTNRYILSILTSAPSGTWTDGKFDALRLRFGFSSDATPDIQLGGLAVMAVFFTPTARTIAIGQTTESDTANAMAKLKSKAIGQATATNTAQPIAHLKSRLLGQATETDTANAMAKAKVKAIGQASETDTSQVMTRAKAKAIGQATETDTSQAMTHTKRKALGQAAETDTANAMGKAKAKALGQATESDSAQAMTHGRRFSFGQATESDSAFALSFTRAYVIHQATEADLAQAITRRKSRSIGQPSEADTATPMVHFKARLVGQVSEIDLAQVLTHAKVKALGLVSESDASQPFTRVKGRTLGQAAETDASRPLTHAKLHTWAQASETDLAQIVRPVRIHPFGQATESDSALHMLAIGPRSVFVHDLDNAPYQQELGSSPYEERRP